MLLWILRGGALSVANNMMEHIVSCTRATYEESTLQAATDAVVQHTRLFSLNELSCNRLGLGVASDSV